MLEDAVSQQSRISETYVDDNAQLRLVDIIGNEDPTRFNTDTKSMRVLWKDIKINFKQDSFKEWWEKIHNVTPHALYGEMASNSVILCVLGLTHHKRLQPDVFSARKQRPWSQISCPGITTLWER